MVSAQPSAQAAYVPRRKPSRDRATLRTALIGLAMTLFSAAWTWVWFANIQGAAKAIGIVGVLVLVGGAKVLVDALRGGDAWHAFRRRSTLTQALVIDRFTRTAFGPDDDAAYETHHVAVRFETGREQVILQARVSEALYRACWRGQMLAVRYANDDPRVALLEGEW